MRAIALIPARGGSKGIKRKNVRSFRGTPLFIHSVNHAQEARQVGEVYVSTEDAQIGRMAAQVCDVIERPEHLAEDDVTTREVEDHAIRTLGLGEGDILVTLHPTSPLRLAEDIDGCVTKLTEADVCRSVCTPEHHPYLMFLPTETGRLSPYTGHSYDQRPPRQYWPDLWVDNGAVWARRVGEKYGGRLVGHEMPRDRSIDIDTEKDWQVAEALMRLRERRAA